MPPNPRPKLTHFLLLPLVTPTSRPQLEASLSRFAADVTSPNPNAPNAAPLPAKAVRPVGSLHLTIGVMSLLTPERVSAACELLRGLDVTAILHAASSAPAASQPSDNHSPDSINANHTPDSTAPPSPLTISLTSLTTHSPPLFTLTSSLHALPTPLQPIQSLAQSLLTTFTTASLIPPSSRPLSLHATLLNTIYARAAPSGKNRWKKGSAKFDARGVMERYRGAVWARDVRVERVAICEMGAKEVVGEGGLVDVEYREVASVGLP